jgi:hypothetical protein
VPDPKGLFRNKVNAHAPEALVEILTVNLDLATAKGS